MQSKTKNKIIEVLGWYGTVAIILAYALVSFSKIGSDSLIYQLLNLTGAIGIVAVSFSKRAYQPLEVLVKLIGDDVRSTVSIPGMPKE